MAAAAPAAKDVYLYRRNLFASLFGQVLAGIDSRARHVGLIIDDPKHGLIVVEVGKRSFRFGGTMAIHVTSMNTFPDDVVSDRSRRLQLDFQCKHIGTTDTEFEVLLEEAKGWLNKNPDYNGGICNCRTFADFALGSTAGTTCLQMNWLSGVLTGSELVITPDSNFNGDLELLVTVTDGELEDSELVLINVLAVNDAPYFVTDILDNAIEDLYYSYTILVDDIDNAIEEIIINDYYF